MSVTPLAVALRNRRHELKLTQESAARLSEIQIDVYRAVEGGRVRDPRISTVARLAKGLGVSGDVLLSTALQ